MTMTEGWLNQMQWPPSDNTARQLAANARIYPSARIASSVNRLSMGDNSFIGDYCFISVPNIDLGNGSQINSGTRIVGRSPVMIGHNTVIGYGCTILTSSDQTSAAYMNDAAPEEKRKIRNGPVLIGERAFIGSHSVIMPDVGIAHGVVVRAFSYVSRNLTAKYAIYGGQPARLIKYRAFAAPTLQM